MKRMVLVSVMMMVVLATNLSAQLIKGYGFKFGMTKATQNWDYRSTLKLDPDSRTGMNIGVFAESIGLLGLSILGELNYTQKGMRSDMLITSDAGPEPIGQQTIENKIDYLSLSLLGKYGFEMLLFKPYLFGGPRIDLEVTKNIYSGFDQVYDDTNKSIIGWSIGGGIELGKFLPIALLVELKYNFDTSKAYESENLTITNRSYELRGGIRF